jgi:hypothetical protein
MLHLPLLHVTSVASSRKCYTRPAGQPTNCVRTCTPVSAASAPDYNLFSNPNHAPRLSPLPPGAIYASQSCDATTLSTCGAVHLLSSTLTSNAVTKGGGGAVHARSIGAIHINCTFMPAAAPVQTASQSGGPAVALAAVAALALHYLPSTRNYTACTTWTSNAAPSPAYGPLLATAAYHLGLNTPSYLPSYASYSALNISLSILDFFNQTISSGIPDSTSTITATCPQRVTRAPRQGHSSKLLRQCSV